MTLLPHQTSIDHPQGASASASDAARSLELDADGFLAQPLAWTPKISEDLARSDGIGALTPKHWEVISHVRAQFHGLGALPVMRLICRAVGLDPSGAHGLFPSCRSLWRIAGLPNPGVEATSYMN
jgi:TusE/DsrC/DsvC family sulfur relay protein